MKKVLFSKELNKGNLALRDFLLNKFSNYVNLKECNLLEVGCGNGRFGTLLGPKVNSYTGIEPDEEYLKIAKETTSQEITAEYLLGRAEKIPIIDKKFDIIFYAFSWHFIQDFEKAISEAKRLLKDGGIIFVYEPSSKRNNWASPRLRKGSAEFDQKLLDKKINDLNNGRKGVTLFAESGFSIVEEDVENGDFANLWILKFEK